MNTLNIFILLLIAIYILQGFHKGFLISVGNTAGMVVSWIVGIIFGPMLSESIAKGSFYSFLLNLTEGSSRLADQAQGNLVVSSLSSAQIHSIVESSAPNLPHPFATLIEENMNTLAFQQQGYSTVNDYFYYTVGNVVVNIFSFLIIYGIARVVIALIINAVNFASPLPVLKRCDELAGGGVGVLRGYLGMFAVMMIIPVLLISMPVGVTLFSDMFAESSLLTYFYDNNFLLGWITGTIPI